MLLFVDLEVWISWGSVGHRRKITALTMPCKWWLQSAVQFLRLIAILVLRENQIRNHWSILLTTKLPNFHVKDGLFSERFIICVLSQWKDLTSRWWAVYHRWLCVINLAAAVTGCLLPSQLLLNHGLWLLLTTGLRFSYPSGLLLSSEASSEPLISLQDPSISS